MDFHVVLLWIVLLSCGAFFCAPRQIEWPIRLGIAYFAAQPLWSPVFLNGNAEETTLFQVSGLWTSLSVVVLTFVATSFVGNFRKLYSCVFCLGLVGASYALYSIAMRQIDYWPQMLDGSRGMNAGLIVVMTVPWLLSLGWWPGLCVMSAIVVLSHSSVPFGVLWVTISAWLIQNGRYRLPIILAIIVSTVGLALERGNFFNDSHRLKAYSIFMNKWQNKANPVYGLGGGNFKLFAPYAQAEHNFMIREKKDGVVKGEFFRRMHSDYLQILFEYGWLGLILFLYASGKALYVFWKRKDMLFFPGLCGLLSFSIFYYPLCTAPGCLLLAVFFGQAFLDDPQLTGAPGRDTIVSS